MVLHLANRNLLFVVLQQSLQLLLLHVLLHQVPVVEHPEMADLTNGSQISNKPFVLFLHFLFLLLLSRINLDLFGIRFIFGSLNLPLHLWEFFFQHVLDWMVMVNTEYFHNFHNLVIFAKCVQTSKIVGRCEEHHRLPGICSEMLE